MSFSLRGESFDFVIVGGGTAGCVLANRLSEDSANRVCLLEAGPPDSHPLIRIPPAIAFTIRNPRLNWRFESAPQVHALGRRLPIPRGHVLGGSSSINGMVYFRGHPGDFDDWSAEGADGWSYREVLPYFIHSERNEGYPHSPYHGTTGLMNVISVRRPNPLVKSFVAASQALGYAINDDFNGPSPDGFGTRQATIRDGMRVSMASAFLKPARRRSNLRVVTDALVTRVLLEAGRAVGVEVEISGERFAVHAAREVIVSAGSYLSPAILNRSGIGAGPALQALGIDTRIELAGVGKGLRDHPSAGIQTRTDQIESYGLSWKAAPRNLYNLVEYALFRRGPLGANVFEAHGFVRSRPTSPRPDLQLVFMPCFWNPAAFPLPVGHGYGMISIAVRPKSRGQVTLAAADPHAAPIIDFNFLAEPDDLDVVRRGLKLARQFLQSPLMKRHGGREISPVNDVSTDDEWDDYIRKNVATVHHPSSTCRMGKDPMAVVDPLLKVYGVESLRVADASVFPTLIAGNSNAAVVMVAEKAADMILGRSPRRPIDLPHAG